MVRGAALLPSTARATSTESEPGSGDKATVTWPSPAFAVTPRSAGGFASYLKPAEPGALTLPAWSVQVPLTEALAVSGAAYATTEQPATPEVASVPANANWTA